MVRIVTAQWADCCVPGLYGRYRLKPFRQECRWIYRKLRLREVVMCSMQSPMARKQRSQVLNSDSSNSKGGVRHTLLSLRSTAPDTRWVSPAWQLCGWQRATEIGYERVKKILPGRFSCVFSKGQSSDLWYWNIHESLQCTGLGRKASCDRIKLKARALLNWGSDITDVISAVL